MSTTYKKLMYEGKEIEPHVFEIKFNVYHSGGCQCFGDCDCIERKGELLGEEFEYTNGITLKGSGQLKKYRSLTAVRQSVQALKEKGAI